MNLCLMKDLSCRVLPGVGMNLQDHLELYVQHRCTQPITLYKAQKPFHMLKIGLEWLLKFTGMSESSIRDYVICVHLTKNMVISP